MLAIAEFAAITSVAMGTKWPRPVAVALALVSCSYLIWGVTTIRNLSKHLEYDRWVSRYPDAAEYLPKGFDLSRLRNALKRTPDLQRWAQLLRGETIALSEAGTVTFRRAAFPAASNLRRSDSPVAFHELTHEEPVDQKLGYQPKSTFFMERSMETFASLLKIMDGIKEGSGTLLDHSLILATSESNYAKIHSLDSLPIMVAGTAGGKWKSGQHVAGKGDATSRVGLTIQQVMGLPVDSWGAAAMQTSRSVSEVIA